MYRVKNRQITLFDYIIYDSDVERKFAEDLESLERVKFYIKLPGWFKIETPMGTYNPDWAVVLNGDKRLYFVAETKGSSDEKDLRIREELKIQCGIKHFEQFDGVKFQTVNKARDLVTQ